MLNATFRPLTQWPGPRTENRKPAAFKLTYRRTLDLLEYELGRLRAAHVVIQIEDPNAIKGMRNDGSFVSTASDRYRPDLPGIILMFESQKGNISMPCDRYRYWQHNLHAIALSLEALRAVDRYGVTRGNEQYRGWARLEAPKNGNSPTVEDAQRFIMELSGHSIVQVEDLPGIIRTLKAQYHPDRAEQLDENVKRYRHEIFIKIGQAEAVLCGEQKK